MLQAGVQDFFDAVQFGAPHLFHFLEAPVYAVETAFDLIEPAVYVGAKLSQV